MMIVDEIKYCTSSANPGLLSKNILCQTVRVKPTVFWNLCNKDQVIWSITQAMPKFI